MPGTDGFTTQLTAALLTKAEGWRGEREWRYLAHNAAHTIVSVPSSTVDVVYVGAKADDETLASVRTWKAARPDLKVSKMSLSRTTFDLAPGPLI